MSEVRVVYDPPVDFVRRYCYKPTAVERRLCCLRPGHHGTCLPLAPWPRKEITAENPAYDGSATA